MTLGINLLMQKGKQNSMKQSLEFRYAFFIDLMYSMKKYVLYYNLGQSTHSIMKIVYFFNLCNLWYCTSHCVTPNLFLIHLLHYFPQPKSCWWFFEVSNTTTSYHDNWEFLIGYLGYFFWDFMAYVHTRGTNTCPRTQVTTDIWTLSENCVKFECATTLT